MVLNLRYKCGFDDGFSEHFSGTFTSPAKSKMQFELLLLFILALCCASGEGNGESKNNNEGRDDNGDGDSQIVDRNHDIECGDRDRVNGNQSNRNCDVYYPCDFEDDVDCIRHYFASSGQCKEVDNDYRKPVFRDRLVTYLPGFNLTIIVAKTRLTYVGDRINRFYVNKKTGNLIMTVDFEGIVIDSRYTTFIYQRRGQEPIKRADYTNGTFPATLTAVIPLKNGLDIKESRVTAYIPSVIPPFFGPKISNSTEPIVVQVNTALYANLPQAVLEYFLIEAPSLYFGYLQHYICDFGIPISS
ncbi:uncharacterized protein LOC135080994 [Ostrinia nubilalis]|uniref:uncharacterized protein LOC135080994 n=1 Tax=Ostrinia nubilalis TaxID=29057 RepID=UPI00308255EF